MEFAGMNSDSETEIVDLNAIIQGALELLLPADSDRCLVNRDLQSQLPSILGRQNQIHQIVTNLVLNSLDAMGDTNGALTVETASVNVPRRDADKCMTGHLATMTGQCVLLRISDDGHGMNQETIDRIFDPYFSTKNNGRGLGLAGVLGIAQRMNAGLTVTSQVGHGTTVCLYFNIANC
jgi:signal transduction histidine kinase